MMSTLSIKQRFFKYAVFLFAIISICGYFGGVTWAEDQLADLFQPSGDIDASTGGIIVDIDSSLINPSGKSPSKIKLSLTDRTVIATKTDIKTRGEDQYTWTGTVDDSELSSVVFTVSGSIIFGNINMDGDSYSVKTKDGTYSLIKDDQQKMGPLNNDTVVPPKQTLKWYKAPGIKGAAAAEDDGSVIDVLVLYTPYMKATYGTGLPAKAQHYVDLANTAYTNSEVSTQLRLVGTEEYYTQNNLENYTLKDALDTIKNSTEVAALRNTYGADLVSLMRIFQGDEACGIGYLMTAVDASSADLAFSVIEIKESGSSGGDYCSDLALAHELGHNMGCAHDRDHADGQGAYSYSYGYDVYAIFGTIMSYDKPRITYFSTPLKAYGIYPIGKAEGQPDSADNAKTINNTKKVVANFRQSKNILTVAFSGTGSGTVSAEGLSCSNGKCVGIYDKGTIVTITATPTTGSAFTGWSGEGCTSGTCTITWGVNGTARITATFVKTYALTITKSGSGAGKVTSSPSGTDCGDTCSVPFNENTIITLTATPDSGSAFTGWSGGGCTGTGTCVITMNAIKTATATFIKTYMLIVTKSGTGTGIVTSSGINCGETCSKSFNENTAAVTLSATPDEGSSFMGWSGAGCSGTGSCTITVNSNTTVNTTFTNTTGNYQFLAKWSGDSQFKNPRGIAVDSSGNVYVADMDNNRIQKFSSSGAFIAQWGSGGAGNGQLYSPFGVTVDSSGNVYVADTYNHRIQKFSSSGAFIAKWGSSGSGDGQFSYPVGVAVDSTGNVYVADGDNNRIQKFSSSGAFITKWGTIGSGDGQFNNPMGIAADSSGNVYVADGDNNRIQKFSSSGIFIAKWGIVGSGDGQFSQPFGVAVDSYGNIYVAEYFNNRIQKISSSGAFLTKWGTIGSGDGQLYHTYGVAVDSSGNVYVADTGNDRIQKFSPNGSFMTKWGLSGPGNGPLNNPIGIAVDSSSNVYVGDGNNRIQKFSSLGIYTAEWGSSGSGDSQFSGPNGIAVDSSGNVYVADTFNNRIQKFSSSGEFITKWGSSGSGDGQLYFPGGVVIDLSGNVYAADTYNNRIQKFSPSGAFISKWGSIGYGDSQFSYAFCVTVDSSGNVYVGDDNNRIQKFSSDGAFKAKWGSSGSGDSQFKQALGIAVDSSGNIYVTEHGNNRVQKFNSSGAFLSKWGSSGSGDGQFSGPRGIAVDSSGNVYVADEYNNRIQKFAVGPSYNLSISLSGTGSGTITNYPEGISSSGTNASYYGGTKVTLTAVPAAGSTFTGWSGGECAGTGTCTLTMSDAKSVTANFAVIYTLSATKSGTGSGSVTSSPAGINCGSSCSAIYNSGTSVTITATPDTGSTFAGWSGGGCTGTGTCSLNMTADTAVTTTFTLIPPSITITTPSTSTTPINGQCGGVNGGVYLTAPSGSDLCSSGTASAVTTNESSYSWTCVGSNGGVDQSCSATTIPDPDTSSSCPYKVTPARKSFTSKAASGNVALASSAKTCTWTATSNNSWITIKSGASGNGKKGKVVYTVGANTSANSRTGAITVAGQTFSVNQAGVPCKYNVSPSKSAKAIISAGGSGAFSVIIKPYDCSWSIAVDNKAPWITINSTENAIVSFDVAANSTKKARSGKINVLGSDSKVKKTFIAKQAK